MSTNTGALKLFAQQTRTKLIALIRTKMDLVLTQDSAELRGYEAQINRLRSEVSSRGEDLVIEEVAYTWFNRVMALRYMDANGYNTPMVVTPQAGQLRPEILQDAMGGSVDEDLHVSSEDLMLPEPKLYRRLLVAACNQLGSTMPFLFEHICDYTELLLPDDLLSEQSFVTDIRNGMTDEDCQNVEVMGWLYQFYITDRKDDAEKKKGKKGGLKSDEQAAATQLFTPHWVVRYMVENSLGRIWMTLHPQSHLIDDMPYYIPTPKGQVDTVPEDISSVKDIRFIDPCCGSGHVLVYAFDLFCKMYEEEGYTTREIPSEVLTHNLYGIDIDRRCYQLASFALTMKARAYHSRYLRRSVQPNLIALQNVDRDVIAESGNWDKKSTMWDFENVDTIGSLLQISQDDSDAIRVEGGLFGESQQILKKQAEYLSRKYHCVVTNPPYLGKGFGDDLKKYILDHFPDSKADTMATFMERCLDLCIKNGKVSMINMQSWMFLSSYENLRIKLLAEYHIDSLLHLGPHAFDEIGGEVVQCATFTLANHSYSHLGGVYYRLVDGKNSVEKENAFNRRENCYTGILQVNFSMIPGSPIGYWTTKRDIELFENKLLEDFGTPCKGIDTGENDYFLRFWTEIDTKKFDCNTGKNNWIPYNKGGGFRKWYGNREYVLRWNENGNELCQRLNWKKKKPTLRNKELWFKESFSWSSISTELFSARFSPYGALFDNGGSCVFSNTYLKLLGGIINSKVAARFYSIFAPTVNFQPGNIAKIPIPNQTFENKEFIERIVEDNISLSRIDWDAHETSWDFKENELIRLQKEGFGHVNVTLNNDPVINYSTLELLLIEYKSYWTDKFNQLHDNEEELNRQFIEIYGLQDELTPDVPLDEITILQKGEISIVDNDIVWHDDVIIKQLISYLVGCFMGRYSVDRPGLIIASQHQDLESLGLKVDGINNGAPGRLTIDEDGIIPILNGEYFADDLTVRIEQAIKTIFGADAYQENLKFINAKLGKPLREYLFKDFYADHIDGKMYQKRPIYWLFSSKMGDKKKKGHFKALVYMHRIEPDTLSRIHADYVVPFIDKITQQQLEAEDISFREDLTQTQRNAARKSSEELKEQLREVKDFEQVLVQMASQRIRIDLDDGVKNNYPMFYPLVEPIKALEK